MPHATQPDHAGYRSHPDAFGRGAADGTNGVAPNITPDPSGIGTWTPAQITRLLTTGLKPTSDSVAGAMGPVVGSVSMLARADLQAIAAYLKSIPPHAASAVPKPPQPGGPAGGAPPTAAQSPAAAAPATTLPASAAADEALVGGEADLEVGVVAERLGARRAAAAKTGPRDPVDHAAGARADFKVAGHDERPILSGATVSGPSRTVSGWVFRVSGSPLATNPMVLCEPSQNGLCAEAPHRQSVAR